MFGSDCAGTSTSIPSHDDMRETVRLELAAVKGGVKSYADALKVSHNMEVLDAATAPVMEKDVCCKRNVIVTTVK